MKMRCLFFLTVIFLTLAFTLNTFPQDYTQWDLPEGAKARLGKGSSWEIAYSPDGTRLAVASSIGIWIYDAETGAELDLLTGHTDWVSSVAFSPDGNTIASGSLDGTVLLWDADTGSPSAPLQDIRIGSQAYRSVRMETQSQVGVWTARCFCGNWHPNRHQMQQSGFHLLPSHRQI